MKELTEMYHCDPPYVLTKGQVVRRDGVEFTVIHVCRIEDGVQCYTLREVPSDAFSRHEKALSLAISEGRPFSKIVWYDGKPSALRFTYNEEEQ
jgi:hypothetical protein